MSRRLKTALPVTSKLLEPCVVPDVLEKLRHRKQVAKATYYSSAKELPELTVGQTVRMKPLPGDRTGIWRQGSCIQRVAPRSYLVDVEGALYRRNRVDLRAAEPTTTTPQPPDSHASTTGPGVTAKVSSSPPQQVDSPPVDIISTPGRPQVTSRYGRLIKPPNRLEL